MDCVEARNLIDSYLDRSISDHDCSGFIEHVRGCKECFEELEIYMAVAEVLNDENKPAGKNSYNFDGRLKADLNMMEGNIKIRQYQKIMGRIIIGAAFLIMGALLYFGLRSRRDGDMIPAWETEGISESLTEGQSELAEEDESVEGIE